MSCELDALIAEKVMGWKFYLETRGGYRHVMADRPNREPLYRIDKSRPIAAVDIDRHKHITEVLAHFQPSTDIAAAWEVVDGLRAKGLSVNVMSNPEGGWSVAVGPRTAWADSAPLAICRAALESVSGSALLQSSVGNPT